MTGRRAIHHVHRLAALGASLGLLCSCAPKTTTSNVKTCNATLSSGAPWTPNVSGAGASNHDATVSVSSQVLTASGPVTGFSQPAPSSQEISFTFPVTNDPQAYGSLQLVADITSVNGVTTAYPMLVYLADSAGHEFINLARAGTGNDCAQSGYFSAWSNPSNYPTQNPNCTVSWPTAYFDYYHWQERQLALPSVNTFPSCNWSAGASTSSLANPECAFNTNFFVNGKLAYGGTYTAKYVLITSDKANAGSATANMKLTVTTKSDSTLGGAVDLNVVLVGNSIINTSRTAQGQLNLNTAIAAMQNIYNTTNAKIKIGTIRVFEWNCDNGGDAYTSLDSSQLEQMFLDGGKALGSAGSGSSINLYMINSFSDNAGILGISGAIGGPAINGTATSGVAVSTFGQLSTWNAGCSGTSCPASSWDSAFNDFVTTMAHESGHYLGLNHPSESTGTAHDFIQDTPICTATSGGYLTINSCLNLDTNVYPVTSKKCSQVCTSYNSSTGTFCPAVAECEFNYLMWWSSKIFQVGTGNADGNLLSPYSGAIINYNPLVQ